MKKNLLQHAAVLRLVVSAAAIVFFASCSHDDLDDCTVSRRLSFEVSTVNSGDSFSATRGELDEQNHQVFTLQGESEADTLFVHSSVIDGIACSAIGNDSLTTRGAIATEMYSSFGVLGYMYNGSWGSSCTPNFMYNVAVAQNGSVWAPANDYYWPGGHRKLRFFAYAPYNDSSIALSSRSVGGAPTIDYTVPTGVADQKDLLVASSAEFEGSATSAALNFGHALTAVQFVVGDTMLAGKITQISLKNVYGRGTYSYATETWSSLSNSSTFSQTLNVNVDGTPDAAIATDAKTFMMIPQTLPSGATIEVKFTDNLTNTLRTLTVGINGQTWSQGKTVVYRISTTSISIVSSFTVTPPADYDYKGGSKTYKVVSQCTVSRPGDTTKNISVGWTAEFVEDDGAGGYNVISKPDWVTAFTTSGTGSSSYTATIGQQTGNTGNPQNDALQAATPVSGTYNLANPTGATPIVNTANCYLINAPGKYSLPLVYGNAIKDGATNAWAYTSTATGTYALKNFVNHANAAITDPYIYNNSGCVPDNAVLVWQDAENLVTNVALSADKHALTFEVGASTIKQGNAVVAVRNSSNEIMWSWHIWVTDYVLGTGNKTVTNYQNVPYNFMPVNIGWCDAESTSYAARSVKVRFTQAETGATQVITLNQTAHEAVNSGNNPYFQFGRKDPMLAGVLVSGTTSCKNKDCFSDSYAFNESGTGKVPISTSILNPHVFYNYGVSSPYDWCSTSYHNLWSANNILTSANDNAVVKTIYDPSPVGYHLPASNAFTGFTSTGNVVSGTQYYGTQINSPYTSSADFTANYGFEFYCNKMSGEGSFDTTGGTIFFPASGYRLSSGVVRDVGSNGYFWSAVPNSTARGRFLYFGSSYVNPLYDNNRFCGYSVRPVQE